MDTTYQGVMRKDPIKIKLKSIEEEPLVDKHEILRIVREARSIEHEKNFHKVRRFKSNERSMREEKKQELFELSEQKAERY
jgi:hypothetical protein